MRGARDRVTGYVLEVEVTRFGGRLAVGCEAKGFQDNSYMKHKSSFGIPRKRFLLYIHSKDSLHVDFSSHLGIFFFFQEKYVDHFLCARSSVSGYGYIVNTTLIDTELT